MASCLTAVSMARADRFVHAMPACMDDDPAMRHARQSCNVAMCRRCQEAPTHIDDTKPPQKVKIPAASSGAFRRKLSVMLGESVPQTPHQECHSSPPQAV